MMPVKRIILVSLLLIDVIGAYADIYDDTLLDKSLEEKSKDTVEKECPPNEHWDRCNAACERNCTNINDNQGMCLAICKPGCVCDRGLVRGHNGKCIRSKKCLDENFCPPNERFDACKGLCELDCRTRNKTIRTDCFNPVFCVSSCRCQLGYVRGPKGTCIKPEECPDKDNTRYPVKRVCPENEVWGISAHCQTNCTHPRPRICPRTIVNGCICIKGYKRRLDGKCIPKEECPKKIDKGFCPPKEKYGACTGLCELDCSTRNKTLPPSCLDRLYCVSSCICIPGYVRGPKGTCIKASECPVDDDTIYPVKRVCPENEVWSGFAHCQTNCTHPKRRVCPRIIIEGCICITDYKRGPDGRCILESECPKKDGTSAKKNFCLSHEEFNECRVYHEYDCGNTPLPTEETICVSGCRCELGYIRGPKGICIKREECPLNDITQYPVQRKCPDNEHWSKRDAHCQKNCTHPVPHRCPKNVIFTGCVCNRGWLRNPEGKCVPKKQCPKKEEYLVKKSEVIPSSGENFCPSNEEYSPCDSSCERHCRHKEHPPCHQICVSGCKCKEGYVRGPKGICIEPSKCPKHDDTIYPVKRTCPEDEEWNMCRGLCQKNCSNINKNEVCPAICVSSCICKVSLIRGPTGKCIHPSKCAKKEKAVSVEDALKKERESNSQKSEEPVNVPFNTGGCPDGGKCLTYCYREENTYGYCGGPGNLICKCGSTIDPDDDDDDDDDDD